jgi:hypothetical protein
VKRTLNPNLSSDRALSFRNQFADQWYDLHNPDQTGTPMVVKFKTVREDFPPNLADLRIQNVLLCFVRANEELFEVPVSYLRFNDQANAGFIGGGSVSIDGVISTRRGNAGSWTPMIGKSPVGEWELALLDADTSKRFKNEDIEDIVLVVTYSGRLPAWPV